jgi:hypothetical protein
MIGTCPPFVNLLTFSPIMKRLPWFSQLPGGTRFWTNNFQTAVDWLRTDDNGKSLLELKRLAKN